MDTRFEALPPLKRFRLMQQQRQQQEQEEEQQHRQQKNQESDESTAKNLCLPAKKRKYCLHTPSVLSTGSPAATTADTGSAIGSITTYSLPAKKRVWAIQPDLSFLDLNIEWKPPSFKETKDECIQEQDIIQQEEEEEEDDGILCAVCQSTDGDSKDPIVFCDGCDLMVHATCYGNPLVKEVPDGDWFCAQCLAANGENREFSCCLCPVGGGAMKPTNDGLWAHVVCAVLVPEVFFEDPEGREGIDCSKVPKTRREKRCYVCKSKRGCSVECSEPKCCLSFHVTCGLSEDLCIEYREGKKGGAVVAGFCKDHTELWKKVK